MLDYTYNFSGVVDLMGIRFDYPEDQVISKRWLGAGLTVYGKTVFTEHNTMFGKTTITILFRVKPSHIPNSKDISAVFPG